MTTSRTTDAWLAFVSYATAICLLWIGTDMAPQTGWPRTDVEVHGSALIVLAVIVKTFGMFRLLSLAR